MPYAEPGQTGAITINGDAALGDFTVVWGASSGQVDDYQWQEKINDGGWSVWNNNGLSLSKNFTNRNNGNYYYQVRACNTDGCGLLQSSNGFTVNRNQQPVAAANSYNTTEDNALSDVLSASDVDGDTLVYSLVNSATKGEVILNSATGAFTYTPDPNANGTDSFSFKVNDGMLDSNVAVQTVNVTAVNDSPIAISDQAATQEDAPLNVLEVLGNDSDIEGEPLTVSLPAGVSAAGGSVQVNSDNTLKYTPAENYNGVDSFNYNISDGNGGTAGAVVTINISAVNDAPLAVNDNASTNQNQSLTINVLNNDSDIEGNALIVNNLFVVPLYGTAVITADGLGVNYTPGSDFIGEDSFVYAITDGQGGTANASVTVTVLLPDEDGDGILDQNDQCPGTPSNEVVNADGCSLSQQDDDQDTINNGQDQCPATGPSEPVNANGCSAVQRDSDQDTINDQNDHCPATIAGATVDADGCAESQKDADGDGVMNPDDLCAATPTGEIANSGGCSASQLDSDGDGIYDAADVFPNNGNETQDTDYDGMGNNADTDDDNDGVPDNSDNCPLYSNSQQADSDNDGIGDLCDAGNAAIQILSPSNGSLQLQSAINLYGSYSAPANSGININGRSACLYDNAFYLNNLKLQPGQNTLTALLETVAGGHVSDSIQVNRNGDDGLRLQADVDCGVAPLQVKLTLINEQNIQLESLNVDYDNNNCPPGSDAENLNCSYPQAGVYTIRAQLQDAQAVMHTLELKIVVQDPQTIKDHLQNVWNNMTAALVAADKDTALSYISGESRLIYAPVFAALLNEMPDILDDWTDIEPLRIGNSSAEYAFLRNYNGEVKLFVIQFIKDNDGVWRIMGM